MLNFLAFYIKYRSDLQISLIYIDYILSYVYIKLSFKKLLLIQFKSLWQITLSFRKRQLNNKKGKIWILFSVKNSIQNSFLLNTNSYIVKCYKLYCYILTLFLKSILYYINFTYIIFKVQDLLNFHKDVCGWWCRLAFGFCSLYVYNGS